MSAPTDDTSVRSAWGVGTIQTTTALVFESVLYGAYVILITFALQSLIRKRDTAARGAFVFMLFASITMFLMSTTLWAMDIYDVIRPLREIIVWTDGSVQDRIDRYVTGMNARVFGQTVVYTFEFLLGDAVVVWRACALYEFKLKVLFAPLLLMTGATVMAFFFVGCIVNDNLNFVHNESLVCSHSQFSTFFLSLTTNAIATTYIIVKAWKVRRFVRDSPLKKTRSERILILLVESGFIYFVIWGAKSFTYFPIVSVDQGPLHFAAQILNNLGNQIVGLYPTIIIVLVHLQQSVWAADGSFSGSFVDSPAGRTLQPIQFASAALTGRQSDDDTAEQSTNESSELTLSAFKFTEKLV